MPEKLDFLLQCGHTSEALPAGLSHSDRMTCVIYQRGQSLGKLIWQSLGEFIPPYPQHTHTHTHNPSLSFFHSLSHTIPSHLFAARLLPKNGSVIFLSSTHQLAVLFPVLSLALVSKFLLCIILLKSCFAVVTLQPHNSCVNYGIMCIRSD